MIDEHTGKIDEAKLEAWRKGIEVQLEEIKELNATRKCIHTFAVRNAASGAVANLDNALLRAIVFDSEERIARRWTSGANVLHGYRKVLRLAIEWGEREIVQVGASSPVWPGPTLLLLLLPFLPAAARNQRPFVSTLDPLFFVHVWS